MFNFTCNVCEATAEEVENLDRETPSCPTCGSTVRFRWIVHAISTGLFGKSIPLPQFPESKHIRVIGMSDWERLAAALSEKFDYKNTFYDSEPKFNILKPAPEDLGAYDVVICSEVFEHITPPVQRAFNNLKQLLRPNGFVVFSTPWTKDARPTREYFPDLFDWKVVELASGYVLVNRTASGVLQMFDNIAFHGGPGQTLEMRLFSKSGLEKSFKDAGFTTVTVADQQCSSEYGIISAPWSRGMVVRP